VRQHGEDFVADSCAGTPVPCLEIFVGIHVGFAVVLFSPGRVMNGTVANVMLGYPFFNEMTPVRRAIFKSFVVLFLG
jgi:hypothetical protein